MIKDSLKNLVSNYFGDFNEMSDDRKDEVFLELHKEMTLLFSRDFCVSDPIIALERINLINNDNKGTTQGG